MDRSDYVVISGGSAVRMRRGKAADVRGAARFLAATAARYGAAVSLTTGSNPSVNAALTQIPDTAWTPIRYPNAFVDEDTGELVSDAEVVEIRYVAFSSQPRHGRSMVG